MFFNMIIINMRMRLTQFAGNVAGVLNLNHSNHSLEYPEDIDVEMNVLGAHTIDLDQGDDDDTFNETAAPSRVPALFLLTRNRIRQFLVLSGIEEAVVNLNEFWYNMGITLCLALCLLMWANIGYPGARIIFPFHKTTGELLKSNYHHLTQMWPGFHVTYLNTTIHSVLPFESYRFHELTQTYIVDEDEDNTFLFIHSTSTSTKTITAITTTSTEDSESPTHAPGFYFFIPTATVSDDFWKAITTASTLTTARATRISELRDIDGDFEVAARESKANAETKSNPKARHVLDAHNGGLIQFEHDSYVKPELEKCAVEFAGRLEGYGMQASEALRWALNECYNDHINALEHSDSMALSITSAHKHLKHDRVKRDIELSVPLSVSDSSSVLDEACDLYEDQPSKDDTKWTAGKCTWKNKPKYKFRLCSETFCDQFLGSRFHKCYKVSNSSAVGCRDRFSAESVYDYLNDAIYECQLCLPRINCGAIEAHCSRVQKRENRMMKLMLLCVGLPVVLLTLAMWLKHVVQHLGGRQEFVPRPAKEIDEEDFAIDDEGVVTNEQETETNGHDVEAAEQGAPAVLDTEDEQHLGVHRRHASTIEDSEE